ncbi:hypothetical protein [Aestuariimicrobium ganziense]|uniref:hypothetical protein n=1 Tax=Aestuariimicrobium ganziense TaxID=2773677 RepID=UPI0019412ABE|nr:hypothetical protein [Aestuariimicrobium ganziense]
MSEGWQLPPSASETGKSAVVRTGPSGLLLGTTGRGDLAVRLFRPQGTRLLLDVPDYAKWLLAFRAMCLGAHLSIISEDHRPWRTLADVVTAQGGTVDLLRTADKIPGAGRPYRPSLVIDDASNFDGTQASMGAWQAIAVVQSIKTGSAVHALRNCDMALVAGVDSKGQENLRRAYLLNPSQLRQTTNLGQSNVVLAMPRRLVRVDFPPTPTEYRTLFG